MLVSSYLSLFKYSMLRKYGDANPESDVFSEALQSFIQLQVTRMFASSVLKFKVP